MSCLAMIALLMRHRSEIEPERLGAFQSIANQNIPNGTGAYSSNDGSIQEANLLLDLSQGTQHPNNSYSNTGRSSGVNQIVNPPTVPLPSQGMQDSNTRLQFNRFESAAPSRPESFPKNIPQPVSLQSPTTSGPHRPSALDQSTTSRSSASHERIAEKPQSEPAKEQEESGYLITTQKGIEECSRLLVADLADEFKLDNTNRNQVQELIDNRMKLWVSSLAHAKPRNDEVAAEEPSPRPKRVRCRICSKTMDRPCDLKKHEKRHSRPWGCTNATCNKTFGSKNDWKRHENSQHYQLETWRCHEGSATSKIGTCAKIFFRRDPFQAHLRRDHGKRDEDYIREQCRKRRIGRNWQNGFWCGFCKDIVRLSTRGLEAWDERFNHIDDMHFKQGQRIDDWYPMDKDLPKGKLKGIHHHHRSHRRQADDLGADGEYMREVTGDGDAGRDPDEESEPELDRTDESEVEDYPAERAKRRRSSSDNDPAADEGGEGGGATPRVATTEWYCVS